MRHFDVSTAEDLGPLAIVLAELARHTRAADIEVLLVGAAARDVLIRHTTGTLPARATKDIDVAVAVPDWPAYQRLTAQLSQQLGVAHRFLVLGVSVDIVAFGGIEAPDRTITWPDGIRMNVLGFREAHTSAVQATLPGEVRIRVASLPAQAVLKLQAYRDRRHDTTRDAVDLRSILLAYSDGPYLDELYEQAADLLQAEGFDPQLAGARRAGRQVRQDLGPDIAGVSRGLLRQLGDLLLADMSGIIQRNRELLAAFAVGLNI